MRVRILHLGYRSDERAALSLDEERSAIQQALARASNGNALTFHARDDVDLVSLPALLAELDPDVLHLATHGEPDGQLTLCEAGQFVKIEPAKLIRILGTCAPRLRLVVLHACFGAALAEGLSSQGRVVIGSTERLPASVAARFAEVLYGRLAEGADLSGAFSTARAAMSAENGAERLYKIAEPDGLQAARMVLAPQPIQLGSAPAAAASPGTLTPHQIVLLLDAYSTGVSLAEVTAQVDGVNPYRHKRELLRLSDQMQRVGAPRVVQGEEDRIDWTGLAEATSALLDQAAACLPDDGVPREYFIAGNAPHATFAQVGFTLSRWAGVRQVLLHRNDYDQRWLDPILLDGSEPADGAPYFDRRLGLDTPNPTNAGIGLFLSAQGDTAPPASIQAHYDKEGRLCGAVASLLHQRTDPNTKRPTPLDARSAASAAAELVHAATDLSTRYPRHSGLTLFIKGPAFLGFLAGRALNPRQHAPSPIALTHYDRAQDAYRTVFCVPFESSRSPSIPQDPAAQLARRAVYDEIIAGLDQLRESVVVEDLIPPSGFVAGGARFAERLLQDLEDLDPGRGPEGEVFELSVPDGRLRIGEGLLEPLRSLDAEAQRRFGRLLVLHELAHVPQRLLGTNYQGVGRAGVVLEDIDFQADTAALLAVTRWEIRDQGTRGARNAGKILSAYLDTHLRALAAFDRMEQGAPLGRLPERRLRRYLIWAVQAARASAARTEEDVVALLDRRLFVELAPLSGRLDGRGDKLVLGARPDTRLFLGLGGRLIQQPHLPENFEPAGLLELVRTLDLDRLVQTCRFLVHEHGETLTSWRAR